MAGPGLDMFGEEERDAILAVLSQRNLSRYRFDDAAGGSEPSFTYRFERDLETFSGAAHCLGMNSCTSALLAGLWAAGIGPGDEVIVPGYTFVATMAAVSYTGATVVLAEVDEALGLDPEAVRSVVTSKTRAIIAVHMLGRPCDMGRLTTVARECGAILVEDCAQAAGGSFGGKQLGTFGAFGAYSLNVFKTFTAGDGGVLLTNDTDLYNRAFAIHDHGARPLRLGVAEADGLLGLNLRMHEVTGAMAWAQLSKLPANLARLRQLRSSLADAIGNFHGGHVVHAADPHGDCATVLLIRFDDADNCQRVAKHLGVRRLSDSGKHNYANIPQLASMTLPHAIPSAEPSPEKFRLGALPRTDDYLARSIALSVGVSDSYLGAGYGLNIHSDEADVHTVAHRFLSAVRGGA
jgi:dTDP-4-amino-4,6-dideoxygalactose transaminase